MIHGICNVYKTKLFNLMFLQAQFKAVIHPRLETQKSELEANSYDGTNFLNY